MDRHSKWLSEWILFSQETRKILEGKLGKKIEALEFQKKLAERLGKNSCLELICEPLPDVENAVELLSDVTWADVGEIVDIDYSILPQEIVQLITEETIKQKGEQWVIHANDADPFPSDPHAHNYASGLKLHLGTGGLYRKREHVGAVKCKHLKLLRSKISNIQLPKLEC